MNWYFLLLAVVLLFIILFLVIPYRVLWKTCDEDTRAVRVTTLGYGAYCAVVKNYPDHPTCIGVIFRAPIIERCYGKWYLHDACTDNVRLVPYWSLFHNRLESL